jgi:hypothetical protein
MKKIVRLTERDLSKIVRQVLKENPIKGCSSLKICKGKTFKANSLDRLSQLFMFLKNLTITYGRGLEDKSFKQVTYGVSTEYPPAPAPVNSPYNRGTFVAFEYKNSNNSSCKILISQRNECITSCPQIYVTWGANAEQYSILEDTEFNRFKIDVTNWYQEAMSDDCQFY